MAERPRPLTMIASMVAAVVALALPAASGGAAVLPPAYSGPPTVGPENVTFLYPTLPATAAAGQLANIGHPRDLVYGTTNDALVPGTADEPAYAHALGAQAYKYAQFTWFPAASRSWMGSTVTQRADWVLCKWGRTPLTDATDGDGTSRGNLTWSYADANERGFVNAVLAWTAQLKALGYDGVFVDVGGRATRGPFWRLTSSCTEDPVVPGARSSDAWFNLLMKVKAQGLRVAAMNIGAPSDVDPFTRRDPADPMRLKTDVRSLDWILHENAARPVENYPGGIEATATYGTPFETLAARIGSDAIHGDGRVIEMAKARLPIDDPDRYRQEEYTWSLAKLSGGPVVLNTGYDFCGVPAGTSDCNRTGLSGALTDIRLGTPIDSAPYAAACDRSGCMWVRRFRRGLVVVSAYGTPKRIARIPLGTTGCRHVWAFQGSRQAGGACVSTLTVGTASPRWSHVYRYRR
jgi:hypothetical protein